MCQDAERRTNSSKERNVDDRHQKIRNASLSFTARQEIYLDGPLMTTSVAERLATEL